MADWELQTAGWRDLNEVRRLEKICFPKDAWPVWDVLGVLTLPNVVRVKAVENGKIIGFAAADIRPSQHKAWIATIGVLPQYRNQGVGGALLDFCEEKAEVPAMRLNVRTTNHEAIQLYRNRGYQQIGRWAGYYSDGEDAIVMEKSLD